MCDLVTKDIFRYSGLELKYTAEEMAELDSVIENVREEQFIDAFFKENSRIDSEKWMSKTY